MPRLEIPRVVVILAMLFLLAPPAAAQTTTSTLEGTVTDTSVTPNVSRTWTYTYNSNGQVLTEEAGRKLDSAQITDLGRARRDTHHRSHLPLRNLARRELPAVAL